LAFAAAPAIEASPLFKPAEQTHPSFALQQGLVSLNSVHIQIDDIHEACHLWLTSFNKTI